MAKRFTDTEIWNKEWYLALSLKHKMLVKFLFDNCDCAGIYEPNFILLSFYIGEKITTEDFNKLKQVKKLDNGNYLIEDFLNFQYGVKSYEALNPKFSVHKGILKSLEKNQLLSNPCLTLKQGLQDMDKDKDKDKDNNSNKQIDTSSKLYGEYLNVFLEEKHYQTLLAMCASEKKLNELINSFSSNIEVGKERPYQADLPNAHFERLKSYYNYRKMNPNKFISEEAKRNVWDRLAEKLGDI